MNVLTCGRWIRIGEAWVDAKRIVAWDRSVGGTISVWVDGKPDAGEGASFVCPANETTEEQFLEGLEAARRVAG